jgi:hypothetical protein
MYWERKISLLKEQFPPSDFRDPFIDWSEILKKIEIPFIIKKNGNHPFKNWAKNIKSEQLLRTIPQQNIGEELEKLNPAQNYWVVFVMGDLTTGKQEVYDCKPDPLRLLLEGFPWSYFIVDKRYAWLAFFKRDHDKQEISIIKSGSSPTPFD